MQSDLLLKTLALPGAPLPHRTWAELHGGALSLAAAEAAARHPGTVCVIASDQMTYYGTIQQDGTFSVAGVPVGPAKLGVYSPDPYFEPPIPPAERAKLEEARRAAGVVLPPKPPKGRWFRLPPKYTDPLSSGLTADVSGRSAAISLRLE